jgi:hypothetical protein
MRDIILGYEVYDYTTKEGRNFNGRVEPSTVIVGNDDILHGLDKQYYNWFIRPDKHGCFFNGYLGEQVPDLFVKRVQVADIKDTTYFYPIEILTITSFVGLNSHISISEKLRADVLNKKAFIVFRYIYEGNMNESGLLEKFNKLVADLSLPKEQILVFHGDQNVDNYKNCDFTYVSTNVFPYWIQQYKKETLVSYNPDKLFLCYNRIIREHRVLLLGLLKRNELIEQGIVSLGHCTHAHLRNINRNVLNGTLTETELLFLFNITGKSPDNLSLTADCNPASNIVPEHYQNTFVSLINETLTDTVFFSEKIYKPILMGHPFILVGGKGSLKKLRDLGFKTFDKWWDESYDECDCFIDRCAKIIEILSSLNNKNTKQLQLMRSFMRPILKHNQDLYNDMIKTTPFGIDREIIEYIRRLL